MVLPTGTITFANLQTEYGGANPVGFNEYYADGLHVPIGASDIPASGAININTFRGKNIAPNYINSGVYTFTTKFGTGTYYGWLPGTVGSINDANVQYPFTSKFGTSTGTYLWYQCYHLYGSLTIQVQGDLRSSGPDNFRIGNQVIARTLFARSFSSGRTTLTYTTSNPFGETAGRRVRVTNYFSIYGESPG